MAEKNPVSVVTGGAGFLGSHLTRSLAGGRSSRHRDRQFDHRQYGEHRPSGREQEFPVRQTQRFEFHFSAGRKDRLRLSFRFSGQPDRLSRTPDPDIESWRARHAQHARSGQGQKGHVHSRFDIGVYGDPLVHPQKEDYWGNVNPIGPRGVYDEAKRFAEAMTMAYHRYHASTPGSCAFSTHTVRECVCATDAWCPAFIGQALSGQPLTIFGDGSQTRSFCYVSDLIDGIFRLAMSDFHEPVNLGNPREMTIKQFADEIIRITGTKSAMEYKPLPVDDPKVRQPDIARAKEVLGWEPRVDFDEGIKTTIEYFNESLKR